MNQMKISIIVPVFNREKYIEETIRSVLSQAHENWELLLVDDGSTDNSFAICKKISEEDNRIRCIVRTESQKGASVCRNIGIRDSRYDWIIFLDSDDLLAPWCLKNRLNVLEKESAHFDFAIFPMLYFKHKFDDMRILQNINTELHPLDRFLQRENVWLMSSVIWSRDYLNKMNGYREKAKSFQDWEINVRALISSDKWKFFADEIPDNFYRQHQETISVSRFTLEHIKDNLDTFLYCFEELKQSEKYSEIRKSYFAALLFEWLKRFSGIAMEKKTRKEIWAHYLQLYHQAGVISQKERKRIFNYLTISNYPLVLKFRFLGRFWLWINRFILPAVFFESHVRNQGKHAYMGLLEIH